MQTFLPYSDFSKSAAVLDRARLGKQRVETMQIMKALTTGQGWVNHPATKMWAGHREALSVYQVAICSEWTQRGYKDTCLEKTLDMIPDRIMVVAGRPCLISEAVMPSWLGNPAFHASHRSNLLRKDKEHYGQFGWDEPDDLEYVWPVPS